MCRPIWMRKFSGTHRPSTDPLPAVDRAELGHAPDALRTVLVKKGVGLRSGRFGRSMTQTV